MRPPTAKPTNRTHLLRTDASPIVGPQHRCAPSPLDSRCVLTGCFIFNHEINRQSVGEDFRLSTFDFRLSTFDFRLYSTPFIICAILLSRSFTFANTVPL